MSKPLQGIKVVEVAMWAFVPACGGMLSDLGAEVIKIEPPTGDPLRALKIGAIGGGGRIDLSTARTDTEVRITVADSGVGIAPEDQKKIFDEFTQVGDPAARQAGTGLGLWLIVVGLWPRPLRLDKALAALDPAPEPVAPVPDELEPQWAAADEFFEAFGWRVARTDTLEADDLLHAFALREEAAGGTAARTSARNASSEAAERISRIRLWLRWRSNCCCMR